MEKVKVIFRKAKNPYTHEYEVVAFFPEIEANYGKILSYMHIGQHSEASVEFYWETKKATAEEYKPLLEELKAIYDDCELVVKRKINYKDLDKAWNHLKHVFYGMEDLTMKKSMVFSFDEFDTLVAEVTYGVVGFSYDAFDGYHYIQTVNDDEWDEWEEEYGEEAGKEVDSFWEEWDEFVVAMIGKKFDAVVENIVVDYFKDMVAIIFE